MNDEGSETTQPAVPARMDRRQPDVTDQLSGLVAPLAQLSLGTVQDMAAVVRSARTTGRDVWRLVNVFDRVRHVDWTGAGDTPAPAESRTDLPAERSERHPTAAREDIPEAFVPSNASGVLAPIVRMADAALKPSTVWGAVVSPVRKAVAETMGLQLAQVGGDRPQELREVADWLIERSLVPDAVYVRRHPAFAQILMELVPDEARILRFLAVAGPQPAIDLRTKTPFQIGSERIAAGINMVAEMAGCSWSEHSDSYLANLNRLGLVVFSKEPVEDYRRYSLLEVQPRALEAIEHCDRSTISIFRSIYLSAFGKQFCEVCVDVDGYDAGGWAVNERGDRIIGRRAKKGA